MKLSGLTEQTPCRFSGYVNSCVIPAICSNLQGIFTRPGSAAEWKVSLQ
jgi:hypothetical protein